MGGNDDQFISPSDGIWQSLQVWTDANHDGVSQTTELRSVAAAGIHYIATHYTTSMRTDKHGNLFRYKSSALINDKHGRAHVSKTYDVFFMTAAGS